MTTVNTTDLITQLTVTEQLVAVTSSEDQVSVTTTEQVVTVTTVEGAVTVVTVPVPTTVTVDQPSVTVLTVGSSQVVTTTNTVVNVVTVGEMGPRGPSAEDLGMQYRSLVDFVTDAPLAGQTTIYKGWASPGTGDSSAAVWKVQKLVLNDEDDIIDSGFAPAATFDQIWDDRLSLVYS